MQNKPNIHIFKDGSKLGPYTKTALKESLRLGTIQEKTPAWTSDKPKWRPLISLLEELELKESDKGGTNQVAVHTSQGDVSNAKSLDQPSEQAAQYDKTTYKIVAAASAVVGVILFSALANNGDKESQGDLSGLPVEDGVGSPSHAVWTGLNVAGNLQEAEKCVLMAQTDRGSGSAFIAKSNGKVYIYTNVHVAAADKLNFIDFNGNSVSYNPIGETVRWDEAGQKGVDLVRFPLSTRADYVLSFQNRDGIEARSNVWALGDSGGENILKSLPGKITGIGPDKIEVDCEFIPGNSGGPIVTSAGRVVGIASYMKLDNSPWAKGTNQEVRRIGWMLHEGYKWTQTTSDDLSNEALMVENCIHASLILMVVMELKASPDGFVLGDYLSDLSQDIMVKTSGHPLNKGIVATSEVVAKNTEKGMGANQNFREYIQFYESCVDYHESAFQEANGNIRSSHFRKMIEPDMNYHLELRENFKSKLQTYRRSQSPYGALDDN